MTITNRTHGHVGAAIPPAATPPAARRFEARGPLAIRPMAMFELFAPMATRDTRMAADDRVAVVCVDGPLSQSGSAWEDGYDTIRERFAAALAAPTVRAVVLKLNSPGGVLYGAIDTARGLRAMADVAGKPFVAYVDGEAASACYALAVAADQIILATNAVVGSIGVIEARPDVSMANAARGVGVTLITSGIRKTYGHPEVPITESELTNTQALVNALAVPFFELVAARRGISVEAVTAMDGGLFTGPDALAARLADRIMSLDAVIASIANGALGTMNYAEIVTGLKALADGDDPNAESARRMLAAMEGEPEGDGEKPKPEDEADPEAADDAEDPEAADDAEDPEAEAAPEKPAAATVSARTAQDLATQLSQVSARLNRVERERDQGEIDRLLTGHPKALRAALRGKPLADVKAIVAAIPKPGRLPAVTTLASKEGTPQTTPRKPVADPETVRRIDRAMGTTPRAQKRGTKLIGGTLFFDVPEDYDPATYGQA